VVLIIILYTIISSDMKLLCSAIENTGLNFLISQTAVRQNVLI